MTPLPRRVCLICVVLVALATASCGGNSCDFGKVNSAFAQDFNDGGDRSGTAFNQLSSTCQKKWLDGFRVKPETFEATH